MQYETALPDDQTMDEVRKRAVSIAPKFDEYPGLNFKLYGVNERREAAVNEYSSIYLWSDLESMRGFLEGDLFDNYSRAFARPSVRSWLIHEMTGDRAVLRESRYCLRQIIPLPRQTKIGEFLKTWTERQSPPEALYRIVGAEMTGVAGVTGVQELQEFRSCRMVPESSACPTKHRSRISFLLLQLLLLIPPCNGG
jgi:hypothetical protein